LNPILSIVSPVYKAEKIVPELVRQITDEVSKITDQFEIILVEDHSPDASWSEIEKCCQADKRVKGFKLSRNFGQHYAITAGLRQTTGEWIVVMDCDLQDRPDEIANLYAKAMRGHSIVYARRMNRQDGFCKRMSSRMFNRIMSFLTDSHSDGSIGNFGIYHSDVIREVNRMTEHARSFGGLIQIAGFSQTTLDVRHSSRNEGKSSYTFAKLVEHAMNMALSASNKPLRLTVKLGFVLSLAALGMAFYSLLARLLGWVGVPGFTSTIFAIWFMGGLQIFVLGICGLYIGKIFDEVKDRPLYVIEKSVNATPMDCN